MGFREKGSRRDRSKAAAIERGVDMLEEWNKPEVAKFLMEQGISVRVIARVLNEPDRRRRPH